MKTVHPNRSMAERGLPVPNETGLSSGDLAQGCFDLEIILDAMESKPEEKFAMTELADTVLHSLLDRPEMTNYIQGTFGHDAFADHNANAWGTEEYARAWSNTRQAFANHGIEIEADPAASRTDGRSAELCFLTVSRKGGRAAELCFLSVGHTSGRKAELCFLSVGRQPN